MKIEDCLRATAKHLKSLGIESELLQGPCAKSSDIQRVEKKVMPLPGQLKQLYTEVGDGLLFSWEGKGAYGMLLIPPLKKVAPAYAGWKELVLWMDDYAFPHVKDAALAKKTYQAMKQWLPLLMDNADGFCIDMGSKTQAVVFHRHDWYDGGTGSNGQVMAPDLFSFIEAWSQVCFTQPKRLYWPETFTKKGVAWTSKHFDEKYILQET